MDKTLYIMRGLQGSGKSTLAKLIVRGHLYENCLAKIIVCSTDDFFLSEGKYTFDRAKLGSAHSWNRDRVRTAMVEGVQFIVVDNTNSTEKEMRPYREFATQFGYTVQVITVGEFTPEAIKRYHARQQHGVPLENMEGLANRFKSNGTA